MTAIKRSTSFKAFGFISTIFLLLLVLPLPTISNNSFVGKIESYPTKEKNAPSVGLTVKILSKEPPPLLREKIDYGVKAVTPQVILRGKPFTATGRLEDIYSGQGIPGQVIKIFWEHFTWVEYESDQINLENNYLIGQGTTNSNGDFSISCADSSHSKSAGLVTVYAVFPGNPLFGPIEQNRQYTTDSIECYAYAFLYMVTNSTIVRKNHSFTVNAALLLDNSTISYPKPVMDAEGDNITIEWLGNITNITISSYVASTTLYVPNSTVIGTYPLVASYNITKLNLPYVVGTITYSSQIGTPAADWCNKTINISIFSGAGVAFTIDNPTAPNPGEYPNILRGNTSLTISGTITDEGGVPFGSSINLRIIADNTTNIYSMISELDGYFSVSFIINNTFSVGDHFLSVDVIEGQGITAQVEYHYITIYGNSTFDIPSANGTLISTGTVLALPGEIIQITGRIADAYNLPASVQNIEITAQWENFGIPETVISTNGLYTINLLIPVTVNPSLPNGSIFLQTNTTQYYSASSTSFTVNVFHEAYFHVLLNQTEIVKDSTVTTIGGNNIYNYSTFTFRISVFDEFSRPLSFRSISVNIVGVEVFNISLDLGGTDTIGVPQYFLTEGLNYNISISLVDNPAFSFNFQLIVSVQATPPPPITTPQTTTTGGFSLSSQFAIGILITVVSSIIIISLVYAFGRLKKAKKFGLTDSSGGPLDFSTLMKMIDEAEQAKDFQRATILCYQAYELICIQDLSILNAQMLSPHELARFVYSTNRVPIRDVTMLVTSYEEARFSDHKILQNSFLLAKQALENIQLALKQAPKDH